MSDASQNTRRESASGRRHMRAVVLALLIGVQLVTLLVVTFALGKTSNAALHRRITEDLNNSSRESADKVEAYLDGPRRLQDLLARLTVSLGERNDALLEPAFADALISTPHVDSVFVGRSDGSFLFVRRSTNGGIVTKIIRVNGTKRTVVRSTRATPDSPPIVEAIEDAYDPRTRPWFTLATEQPGDAWTDPYVFSTSKKPGITTASVIDPTRPDSPVVGVDIELAELHQYVRTLRIGARGTAEILDSEGVPLDTVSDPGQRVFVPGGIRTLKIAGEPASRVVVPVNGSPNWQISLTVFEADYFADSDMLQRRLLLVALCSGVATTLVAWVLYQFLKRRIDRLADQANVDQLTGISNRARLLKVAERRLQRNQRSGKATYVCLLDIDAFKTINDTYGHAGGDQALKTISDRLMETLRTDDLVGRYGGEEFLVLFDSVDLATAEHIVNRIRSRLSDEPVQIADQLVVITASAGVVASRRGDDSSDLTALIAKADAALYEAKRLGRNRTVFADDLTVVSA